MAATDEERIWRIEQEFYERRGAGDLSYYASKADADYTVWAPGWDKPNDYQALLGAVEEMGATTAGETISATPKLVKIERSGQVALVYYSTHRTTRPGGEATDDRYDTLHVWIRRADGWKLLGGMARTAEE